MNNEPIPCEKLASQIAARGDSVTWLTPEEWNEGVDRGKIVAHRSAVGLVHHKLNGDRVEQRWVFQSDGVILACDPTHQSGERDSGASSEHTTPCGKLKDGLALLHVAADNESERVDRVRDELAERLDAADAKMIGFDYRLDRYASDRAAEVVELETRLDEMTDKVKADVAGTSEIVELLRRQIALSEVTLVQPAATMYGLQHVDKGDWIMAGNRDVETGAILAWTTRQAASVVATFYAGYVPQPLTPKTFNEQHTERESDA